MHINHISNQHFVFFANASATIGAGHVMRLFALAQSCVLKGVKVSFASYECPDYLLEALRQEGFAIISVPKDFTRADIQAFEAEVIVVDDYCLSDEQWHYFRASKALLVNIDDELDNKELLSDIIINPSASATSSNYKKRAPQATFCLGPTFALLRKEFIEEAFIDVEQRKSILISLGGADVKNMSLALTHSLLKNTQIDADVYVLLGGLNKRFLAPLQALSKKHDNLFIIEKSQQVAALMMQAGLAISAAGGTLAELASAGTPSIALVSVDNQKAALSTQSSHASYYAFDVRNYIAEENGPNDSRYNAKIIEQITTQASKLWRDLCKRKLMSTQARQLIDGKGCERVVERILRSL